MKRKAAWFTLGLAAMAIPVSAQNIAQRNISIRAGVVVIDSQQTGASGTQANLAPYVWFNLDSNANIKPAGWTFYNPNAATRVTDAIRARWLQHNLDLGLGAAGGPNVGDTLTKRDAPYWEVFLGQASDAQITSYDILVLPAYRNISLNPLEREKLRKFMEAGGVLWVDVMSGGFLNLDIINNFSLPFIVSNTNLGTPAYGEFGHPLLSVPHAIGYDSLSAMQAETVLGLRNIDLTAAGFADIRRQNAALEGDTTKLLPVAIDNLGPAIAVGQVGDGYLVATCRGVATTLNRTQDSAGTTISNQIHKAYDPQFTRSADAAARLAVNMTNLTSGHSQIAKGAHKANSTPIDVGAPLLKRFDAPGNLDSGPTNYVPPVIFGGMAIVSAGDRIFVYDANPSRDLNADGNPDDGFADYSRGANVDLIWASQPALMPGPISAPAAAEIPDAAGAPQLQISVTDANGGLWIFNAVPAVQDLNVINSNFVAPPGGTSPADLTQFGRGPYSPTYHDGLIFMSDEANAGIGNIVGRVWIADARTGTNVTGTSWLAGGSTSPNIQRPTGSVVVGYIPIADNSGGVDRVAYVPTRPNSFTGVTAGITSVWIGAKGEKPVSFDATSGPDLIVNTRASTQGLSIFNPVLNHPLGLKLTILDASGNPLNAATMDALFTNQVTEGNGVLNFQFEGAANRALVQGVRVDYTIDWGTGDPGKTSLLVRGQIFLPDHSATKERRILHNMALSPQGTLHFVDSAQSNPTVANPHRYGGAFYSLREEGRGAFKMLNRFELYPTHTVTLNQTAAATVQTTLVDNDGLQSVNAITTNFLSGPFSNLAFQGGPSIRNGVVYVTARGMKVGFVPCTILMAFLAEPDIPKIEVGEVNGGFTIVQPDFARSTSKTVPDQFSTLQANQYVYEREPGADRGTIRIDNLATTTRGAIQQSISRSQPIILRRSNQPDLLIEPNRTGSRWNPLLWYAVVHGVSNDSPPTVTGETAFFAGNSALPYFLNLTGPPVLPPPTTGVMTGLDADVSPTDPFLISDSFRPWLKQVIQLKNLGGGNIQGNPAIRWPQYAGVTSFESWAVRYLATTLGKEADALGVVAGDGVLLSWAPANAGMGTQGGLWGFSNSEFLVADEGRLGRFDPAGNPRWLSDSTLITGTSGDVGAAAETRPLVRPTRAYPLGSREMVVVDTAANRIIRLSQTGRELRSLNGFIVDPGYVPDGFDSNESLTFKAPRDVLTFSSYETTSPFVTPAMTGPEIWIHYIVADSSNKRLLEIVDRYRSDANRRNLGAVTNGLGMLYWHSPSSFSGKNFDYTSVARVFIDDPVPANSRWVYAAGIGSALPTRVDTGLDSPTTTRPRESEGGNGGIVIFDGPNSQVINEVTLPATGANVFYNPATGAFDMPARAQRQKLLGNLTSVTMRNVLIGGVSYVAIMFTDADGVFEITPTGPSGAWLVTWMLPREAYRAMRHATGAPYPLFGSNPKDLRAYFARRLDSGEVLLVNGYTGSTLAGASFDGEIIQVDGEQDPTADDTKFGYHVNKRNLGFKTFSIRFELPPIQGARGLVIPVFADRR